MFTELSKGGTGCSSFQYRLFKQRLHTQGLRLWLAPGVRECLEGSAWCGTALFRHAKPIPAGVSDD